MEQQTTQLQVLVKGELKKSELSDETVVLQGDSQSLLAVFNRKFQNYSFIKYLLALHTRKQLCAKKAWSLLL